MTISEIILALLLGGMDYLELLWLYGGYIF